jgi:hypothetical protein
MLSDAFRPEPVSTSTMFSPLRIVPRAINRDRPAAAAAEVGST